MANHSMLWSPESNGYPTRLFFMPQRPIQNAPRSEGGWGMIQTRNAAKPLSFISLIPLWLSHLHRPPPLATREKGGDESDPPPKKTGPSRSALRYGSPGSRCTNSSERTPLKPAITTPSKISAVRRVPDGFEARRLIDEWIGFYNTERPHSALDGKTPLEAYRGDPPVGYDGQAATRLAHIPTGTATATGRSIQEDFGGMSDNRNTP